MVRLERANSPQDVTQEIARLAKVLQSPSHTELRKAFTVWINRVVLRRFAPEAELPQTQNLTELHAMITERIERWEAQFIQQGVVQGVQRGKLEGQLEGQAQALRRLLTRRFGELPVGVLVQISEAHQTQVEMWLDRSVDAISLGAVFTPH